MEEKFSCNEDLFPILLSPIMAELHMHTRDIFSRNPGGVDAWG